MASVGGSSPRIGLSATVSGNGVTGTYTVAAGDGPCFGDSGTFSIARIPSTSNLTGRWSGMWRSPSGFSGALSAQLVQQGTSVSGPVTFTGSPCFAGGQFSGTNIGNVWVGSVASGSIVIGATVHSTQMGGSYYVVSGGACTGDSGTFSLVRQ